MKARGRPEELPSKTRRFVTEHGNIYVTLTYKDGQVFECFTTAGKPGGLAYAHTEAVTRLISLWLRGGGDPLEVAKQLRGIQDSPQMQVEGIRYTSIYDAIAQFIQQEATNEPT